MPKFAIPSECDVSHNPEYMAGDPYPHKTPTDLREFFLSKREQRFSPLSLEGYQVQFNNQESDVPCEKSSILKKSLLQESSLRAQALRRKLIYGTNVLIVQGGSLEKRPIYARLHRLGVNIYIMDDPKSIWSCFVGSEVNPITSFIPLTITSDGDFVQQALSTIEKSFSNVEFHCVTTYYEDAVAIAARIAKALKVSGADVKASDRARSKHRTREAMSEAGLAVPRFTCLLKESDIPDASKTVGFPAVIKPSFGAASIGVTRVDSETELLSAFQKLRHDMKTDGDPLWLQGTEIICEEYYDGDEFDVDMLLSNGKTVYAKISDNWAVLEPWFQETGMHCPSSYPATKQRELVDVAEAAVKALGFKHGCLHVECRYTSHGPRIIEVNGRMGGDPVYDFNRLVWGVDLVEEHYMSTLGIPINPLSSEKPLQFVAEFAFNAPYSGLVNSDCWLEGLRNNPLVYRMRYFKRVGDKVTGPEEGVPDWLGEIIVVGRTSQAEANDFIRDVVENKVEVPITPNRPDKILPFFFPSTLYPFKPLIE